MRGGPKYLTNLVRFVSATVFLFYNVFFYHQVVCFPLSDFEIVPITHTLQGQIRSSVTALTISKRITAKKKKKKTSSSPWNMSELSASSLLVVS